MECPHSYLLLGLLHDDSVGLAVWGFLVRAVLCFRCSGSLGEFPPEILPCAMISLSVTVCT